MCGDFISDRYKTSVKKGDQITVKVNAHNILLLELSKLYNQLIYFNYVWTVNIQWIIQITCIVDAILVFIPAVCNRALHIKKTHRPPMA